MRAIAKVFGVLFIVGALYGFVDTGFGLEPSLLLGSFPVNAVLNIVHLGLGIWGYASSRDNTLAGHFCRWAGVVFLALGAAGFAVDMLLGLLPLGGDDRFLHLGVGVVLLAVGLIDATKPRPYHRSR